MTKQKIVEEFETGVEPFYKNPKLRGVYEEYPAAAALGVINQTFENDDYYRLNTVISREPGTLNDRMRIKF